MESLLGSCWTVSSMYQVSVMALELSWRDGEKEAFGEDEDGSVLKLYRSVAFFSGTILL